MRTMRRRQRTPSPLASAESVRFICQQLREHCPEIIPRSEKHLLLMLEAVRNIERRPATDTKRGRPPRWPRPQLLEVARHLRAILERETSGKIALQSFIGQYLRILRFPSDVQTALASGDINLQEAVQLARLTDTNLGCTSAQARTRRAEALQAHLTVQGSQSRLREQVKGILGETPEIAPGSMAAVVDRVDELLEIDPADTRHLFWEEMKRIFFAMREIQPEDLDDETLNDFMGAMDQLSNILYRIELRRRRRQQPPQKLRI